MFQTVSDRGSQSGVRFDFLLLELGAEPGVQFVHDRATVLLVKAQSFLRRQTPFLRLGVIGIDLAQAFEHITARLGKVGHDVDVTAPGMRLIWGPRLRALSRQWNYPEFVWRAVGRRPEKG